MPLRMYETWMGHDCLQYKIHDLFKSATQMSEQMDASFGGLRTPLTSVEHNDHSIWCFRSLHFLTTPQSATMSANETHRENICELHLL